MFVRRRGIKVRTNVERTLVERAGHKQATIENYICIPSESLKQDSTWRNVALQCLNKSTHQLEDTQEKGYFGGFNRMQRD